MMIRGLPTDRVLTDQEILISIKNEVKESLIRLKLNYQGAQLAGLTAKGKQSEVVVASMVKIKRSITEAERGMRVIDKEFEELKANGEVKVKK